MRWKQGEVDHIEPQLHRAHLKEDIGRFTDDWNQSYPAPNELNDSIIDDSVKDDSSGIDYDIREEDQYICHAKLILSQSHTNLFFS